MFVLGYLTHDKHDKLFIIQKSVYACYLVIWKKCNDKFCTCARRRHFDKQILGQDFYVKDNSKPFFNRQKLLTVLDFYKYFEILKILKLRIPMSIFSFFKLSDINST